MAKTKKLLYNYNDIHLPVEVHFERRSSSRVSLGKSAIVLRVPSLCRGALLRDQLSWMGGWLEKTFAAKPEQLQRLLNTITPYQQGQEFKLYDGPVTLELTRANRKSIGSAFYPKDRIIQLSIPEGHIPERKSLSNAISRALAKHYQPHFEVKVFDHNQAFFQKPIREVRLKNNSSNWGSCSTNSIINLSTRLLLVPEPVQDYVVIHELAHLLEMNHSTRFWSIVENAMPEYRQHERWLKEYGAALMI